MRTSKLFFLIAIVLGWTSSTLEAQQYYSIPVYRSKAGSTVVRVSNLPASNYGTRNASSTQWYPYVIARPADRSWMREMPVANRPNRPLHFWGNSRRRLR